MARMMTYTRPQLPANRSRSLIVCSLLMIFISVVGCQSQPKRSNIVITKGMDYKLVLDAYGKPKDVEYLPSYELTRYYWTLSDVRLEQTTGHTGPSVSATGTISPGASPYQNTIVRRIYCDLIVSVDQQNKVASWDAKGTGCRQILYNQI